jgi:hypothetical protein
MMMLSSEAEVAEFAAQVCLVSAAGQTRACKQFAVRLLGVACTPASPASGPCRPLLANCPYAHFSHPCCLQHGWEVANGRISFKPAADKDAAAASTLPSLDIINHCLDFARELERIV